MQNLIRVEPELFQAAERIATRRKLRPATIVNLLAAEGLARLYPDEATEETAPARPAQLAEQAA